MAAVLLLLEEILADGTQDSSADGSEESMVGFLAQEMATDGTAKGAENASIGFIHGRCIGVVVGGVGVG